MAPQWIFQWTLAAEYSFNLSHKPAAGCLKSLLNGDVFGILYAGVEPEGLRNHYH